MDKFLERVIAQRAQEQARSATFARHCLLCKRQLKMRDESPATVCTRCGGRKRQKILEKELEQQQRALETLKETE